MRLILHVGATKTGSSALQASLFRRRADLRALGVHYGETGVVAGAHHLIAAAPHPRAWQMHPGALPEGWRARMTWAEEALFGLRAGAEAARCRTVLVSSEYLWGVFEAPMYAVFARAFDPGETVVAAFLRRPEDWVHATWVQAVKSGEARSFPDWCAAFLRQPRTGLRYFDIVDGWQAGLAAEGRRAPALRIGLYDDAARADVVAAFARLLDLPELTAGEEGAPRANLSPDADGVRRMLALNRERLPERDKSYRRQRIGEAHAQAGSAAATPPLPAPIAGRIRDAARPGLHALAHRHGVQVPPSWLTS